MVGVKVDRVRHEVGLGVDQADSDDVADRDAQDRPGILVDNCSDQLLVARLDRHLVLGHH